MTNLPEEAPPPYSETDIFSVSGGSVQSTRPLSVIQTSPAHPSRSGSNDNASIASTTTTGDPIYTPPLTPRSPHHSQFTGEDDHVSLASSAAAAYFESRPAPRLAHEQVQIVHCINVDESSAPDSFPYPATLAERDVNLQDWQTFLNYLLPHFTVQYNEQVVDRKLAADTGREASQPEPNSPTQPRNAPVNTGTKDDEHKSGDAPTPRTRTDNWRPQVHFTVREWNEGFFGPRKITIRAFYPVDAEEPLQMPGAWNPPIETQSYPEAGQEQTRGGETGLGQSYWDRLRLPFTGGRPAPGSGFGFRINNEGISFGDNFVVDSNGIRLGRLAVDSNGIALRGSGERDRPSLHDDHHRGFGRGGGRHEGPFHHHGDEGRHDRGWGRRQSWGERGRGMREDRHGDRHGDEMHKHDRSPSCSSTSSSSSESSIESLPDYDEVPDLKLPDVKTTLQSFIAQPETITTAKVKDLKRQIKAARKAPENQPRTGINEVANLDFDRNAMRKEVRGLLKEWKKVKRQQKALKRQLKAERRQAKRAAKRERRNAKREVRNTQRQVQREARRERRGERNREEGTRGDGTGGPYQGGPYRVEDGFGFTHVPAPPLGVIPHGPPPFPPMEAAMQANMRAAMQAQHAHGPIRVPQPPTVPVPHIQPPGVPAPHFDPLGPHFNPFGAHPHHRGRGGFGRHAVDPWSRGPGRGGPGRGRGPFGWGGPFDALEAHRTVPGSWPGDNQRDPDPIPREEQQDTAHRSSAAAYRQVAELTRKRAAKEAELAQMRATLLVEEQLRAQASQGSSSTPAGAGVRGDSKVATEVAAIEKELESLTNELSEMQIEAIEASAREQERGHT